MANKPQKFRGKWRIRWVDADGKRHSEVHGTRGDAQLALARKVVEREEVQRGLRGLKVTSKTVGELCDLWLATRAKGKRSGHKDESFIRVHLRPAFGDRDLRKLGPDEIELFKNGKHAGGLSKKTVNLLLTLLVSMLNLAVEMGWLDTKPKVRKFRITLLAKDYRWLRTDEEVARFLSAAREEGEHVHALYASAVYTGMRAGELAGLRWADVNFERRLITVQRSFGGPTKSDEVRHVPILDVLLPVLRAHRLRMPLHIVFPNRAGSEMDPSARIFQEVLHRVLKRAGLPDRCIVFHSLRHTFASAWMMKGGDLFRLQKILGHASPQVTARYSHLSPNVFKEDYSRFGSPAAEGEVLMMKLASSPSDRSSASRIIS